jgi:hypothetical protein
VLLAFFFGIFIVSAGLERRGRPFPFRWLMLMTTLAAMSFYSLRMLS